jgi:hypothetical protein
MMPSGHGRHHRPPPRRARVPRFVVGATLAAVGATIVLNAGVAHADTGGVNWGAIAACESGGNWHINTGNGFHGGLQFSLGTWRSHGGVGLPELAPPALQISIANNVLHTQGLGAWPVCGRHAHDGGR